MTGNSAVIGMISAIMLAAIGMNIAGGAPWKGAVLAVVFIVGGIITLTVSTSPLIAFVAGAIFASIVSSAMKIPPKQSGNALLGCAIGILVSTFAF